MTAKKKRPKYRLMTFTGREVDLLTPTADMICIEDVAHGLSMQCRYNGQIEKFMSVAEHSMIVATGVEAAGGDRFEQLCGLMHDAHEAYIGDMLQPMKEMPGLGDAYKALEEDWIEVVEEKFDLWAKPVTRRLVHRSDMNSASTEMRDLTTYEKDVWQSVGKPSEARLLQTMLPEQAETAFLLIFNLLQKERRR